VNCQHPRKDVDNSRLLPDYSSRPQVTNGADRIHIESSNTSMSKVSVVSTRNKTQVPTSIKPAIQNATDKVAKSLGTNNRVTITVPNGVQSHE